MSPISFWIIWRNHTMYSRTRTANSFAAVLSNTQCTAPLADAHIQTTWTKKLSNNRQYQPLLTREISHSSLQRSRGCLRIVPRTEFINYSRNAPDCQRWRVCEISNLPPCTVYRSQTSRRYGQDLIVFPILAGCYLLVFFQILSVCFWLGNLNREKQEDGRLTLMDKKNCLRKNIAKARLYICKVQNGVFF